MRIAVIDGQGGKVGSTVVEKLKKAFAGTVTVIALGTNSLATSSMLKNGADEGATGENAMVFNLPKVDIIVGPVGIISANSFLGELTPLMATAIAESPAQKILIPMNRCNVFIAGITNKTLPQYIDDAIRIIKEHQ